MLHSNWRFNLATILFVLALGLPFFLPGAMRNNIQIGAGALAGALGIFAIYVWRAKEKLSALILGIAALIVLGVAIA